MSTSLQRIQIIKGWLEEGQTHEAVFDVACSGGLKPDPVSHRCPDLSASVNIETCAVSTDKGSSQLQVVWQDPDFSPQQQAFYYVRVLENPSCRWSTWDAVRNGIMPHGQTPLTIQERAWTSPIWYIPKT